MPMDGALFGKVLWFNNSKGYGEIYGEDGSSYFFTYKEISSPKRFKTIEREAYVKFVPSNRLQFGRACASQVRTVSKKLVQQLPKQEFNI